MKIFPHQIWLCYVSFHSKLDADLGLQEQYG